MNRGSTGEPLPRQQAALGKQGPRSPPRPPEHGDAGWLDLRDPVRATMLLTDAAGQVEGGVCHTSPTRLCRAASTGTASSSLNGLPVRRGEGAASRKGATGSSVPRPLATLRRRENHASALVPRRSQIKPHGLVARSRASRSSARTASSATDPGDSFTRTARLAPNGSLTPAAVSEPSEWTVTLRSRRPSA
jgi:hypothetical protein